MGESETNAGIRQLKADIHGTGGVPHRSLGRCLRGMRQEAGLSIEVAARAIGRGAGTLHRLETGAPNVIVRDEDLRRLCKLYQRVDMLPVLKSLAAQGRTPSWLDEFPDQVNPTFNAYVQMEASASRITVYRPDMVPGLFQAPDYARALDRVYFPMDTAEEIERRVRVDQSRWIDRRQPDRQPIRERTIGDRWARPPTAGRAYGFVIATARCADR
ncbi:Scr1 family TA system antitoxin-like transcriptional regulator [Nocardia gipuzkoensis]